MLIGTGARYAIVVVALECSTPSGHWTGCFVVGGEEFTSNGIAHGLCPEVGFRIDKSIVELDTVFVVKISGS